MIRSLGDDTRSLLSSSISVSCVSQCVTELVQNSITSEASRIDVSVDLSTFTVRVSDNGIGIARSVLDCLGEPTPANTKSAFHSQSTNAFSFSSGLSGICSLSCEVDIATRRRPSTATLVKTFSRGFSKGIVSGGAHIKDTYGTVVTVRGLFARLPVRQKRIVPVEEMRDVRFRLAVLSLAHPSVGFTLLDEVSGSILLRLVPTSNIAIRFGQVFGHVSSQLTQSVDYSYKRFRLQGCVYFEQHHNASRQFIFVNGRELRDNDLLRFVDSFLAKYLLPRSQPAVGSSKPHGVFALLLSCPTAEYEICSFPGETWIEFKNRDRVMICIREALKSVLSHPFEGRNEASRKKTGDVISHFSLADKQSLLPAPGLHSICGGSLASRRIQRVGKKNGNSTQELHSSVVAQEAERKASSPLQSPVCSPAQSTHVSKVAISPVNRVIKQDGSGDWLSVFDDKRCEYVRVHRRSGLTRRALDPDTPKWSLQSQPASSKSVVSAHTSNETDSFSELPSIIWADFFPWLQEERPDMHLNECRLNLLKRDAATSPSSYEFVDKEAIKTEKTLKTDTFSRSQTPNKPHSSAIAQQFASWKNPVFPARLNCGRSETLPGKRHTLPGSLNDVCFEGNLLRKAEVVGQIDNKFIACLMDVVTRDSAERAQTHLVLVDQHAADERVGLEQIEDGVLVQGPFHNCTMSACRRSNRCTVVRSSTVAPLAVQLGREELALCRSYENHLRHIGVCVAQVNLENGLLLVETLPEQLLRAAGGTGLDEHSSLADLAACLVQEELAFWSSSGGVLRQIPPVLRRAMASHACHGAVRFGDSLSRFECSELVCNLSSCRLPFQCAHGRPSVVPLLDIHKLDCRPPPKKLNFSRLKSRWAHMHKNTQPGSTHEFSLFFCNIPVLGLHELFFFRSKISKFCDFTFWFCGSYFATSFAHFIVVFYKPM